MQVKEAMTPQKMVVDPRMTLSDAVQMMKDLEVSVLPVATRKGLVGVLTDRHIAIRVERLGLDTAATAVHRVMDVGLAACYKNQDVEEAAEIMRKQHTDTLVILDENRCPVGVLDAARVKPAIEFHDDTRG